MWVIHKAISYALLAQTDASCHGSNHPLTGEYRLQIDTDSLYSNLVTISFVSHKLWMWTLNFILLCCKKLYDLLKNSEEAGSDH